MYCIHTDEWKGYNVYGIGDLKLLDNIDNFANSLIIFDDMGENIRLPAIDSLYSEGRHQIIDIICVANNVTDFIEARENTPAVYINLNSSQQFFERVQGKFDSNLYRFKHYKYGIVNCSTIGDYYIVLDKVKNVVYDSTIGDIGIEKYIDYTQFKEKEFNMLSRYLIDRTIIYDYLYIYHFEDKCKDNRTGTISSVQIYIDYIYINNSDSNSDNNDLKDIIIQDLKD